MRQIVNRKEELLLDAFLIYLRFIVVEMPKWFS